jgi:DMSO/TMAO reductase YedYZ molybdopterin-dependent catalytic subunit
MREQRLGTGVVVGLSLALPVLAVLALAARLLGLPFAPYFLFDGFSRALPGPVITFGIDAMITTLDALGLDVADTAKTAERAMAVVGFVAAATVAAVAFFAFFGARRARPDRVAGLVMGALFGLPVIAVGLAVGGAGGGAAVDAVWLGVVFLAWGVLLAWAYRRTVPPPERPGSAVVVGRRRFLVTLGAASAAVTVVGAGLARFLAREEGAADGGGGLAAGGHASETGGGAPFPNAGDPVMPAPGTRPEYTPLKDHYEVFIRTEPTVVDGDDWRLDVGGLVERPRRLTLAELRSRYPRHDRYVTISCISGRVGTGLIGTTLWSGLRLADLLADVGLDPAARWLRFHSADGFHETVDRELVEAEPRLLLCYDWDGHALPTDHGFPLRLWIPDRYGMKQPKWIQRIEAVAEYEPGYWVSRGWDRVARVKATSVIDTVAVDAAREEGGRRLVPVGGIAYAGARGVSRVEVRVDDGPWQGARLRSPLSDTTWVVWRWEWPFEPGEHTFTVRCAEADGTPQVTARKGNRPDGASGLHRMRVEA